MKYPELDYLEFFVTPFQLELENIELDNLPLGKYNHAVVVGRFQPLHYGHVYLIKQALQLAGRVTIGIGSANVTDEDNPWTPEQRQYMLEKAIKSEGISRIDKIVYLDDIKDDHIWVTEALKKIGKVDAIIGNNEWVNGCFENVGIESRQVPLLQRGIYRGKRIRAFLRQVGKL